MTRALYEHQHSTQSGAHMPFQMELMGEMTALLSLILPSQIYIQVVPHGLDQSQRVTPFSLPALPPWLCRKKALPAAQVGTSNSSTGHFETQAAPAAVMLGWWEPRTQGNIYLSRH